MKKIAIEKIAAYYGFNSLPELFAYIIESKTNGQPQQVKEILSEMCPTTLVGFLQYLDKLETLPADAQYCRAQCYDAITQFSRLITTK